MELLKATRDLLLPGLWGGFANRDRELDLAVNQEAQTIDLVIYHVSKKKLFELNEIQDGSFKKEFHSRVKKLLES